jgi:quercetin dioxygenase-like cupin family protein
VGELGHAAAAVAPRAATRERLLARLQNGSTLVRASETRETELRRLGEDEHHGRVTSLVRMGPGADVPAFRASDTRELYVLSGELTVAGRRLGAGDYCVARHGLPDEGIGSENGGVFVLISASASDDAAVPGDDVTIIRASDVGWRTDAPGVEVRPLAFDRERGTLTAVMRMAAGTRLPRHDHVTAEQIYLLSGDAFVGGETLGAGDYFCTPAGTSHDVTYTEHGCEFLLIDSAVSLAR